MSSRQRHSKTFAPAAQVARMLMRERGCASLCDDRKACFCMQATMRIIAGLRFELKRPPRNRLWTDDRVTELRRRLEAHEPYKDIAAAMGLSFYAIAKQARKVGHVRKPRNA